MDHSAGNVSNGAGGEAFDPYNLRPLASLNRRRLSALPGIPPDWVDQTGWALCAKASLIQLIQAQDLGLEASSPPEELPRRLNELLAAPEGPARRAAGSIAAEYGRRLGYLIATLMLSPQGLSVPPSDWEAAYLQYWRAEVQTIVLGGGMANGGLGQEIAAAASGVLVECGLADRRLLQAAHPSYLPLIGAARRLPAGPGQVAALVDFGQSRAKRGLAAYDRTGVLSSLRIIPTLSVEHLSDPGRTSELATALIASLVETMRQAGPEADLSPLVTASVAAYIRDGRPDLGPGREQGAYALSQLSEDITAWFSARITEACSRPVQFRFAHDGSSAGSSQAGQPHTAVIMLGTSLGVGFAPPKSYCRPLASDFTVET